jgi:hypothetical protein
MVTGYGFPVASSSAKQTNPKTPNMPTTSAITPDQAREIIRTRGWTYRAVSKRIGKSPGHIHGIVTGKRTSTPVLSQIAKLPTRKVVAK